MKIPSFFNTYEKYQYKSRYLLRKGIVRFAHVKVVHIFFHFVKGLCSILKNNNSFFRTIRELNCFIFNLTFEYES